jgi:hypothetical protein
MLGAIEKGLAEANERARRTKRGKRRDNVVNLFGPRPAPCEQKPQPPLTNEELSLLREIIEEYSDNYGGYMMKQGLRGESLARRAEQGD